MHGAMFFTEKEHREIEAADTKVYLDRFCFVGICRENNRYIISFLYRLRPSAINSKQELKAI